MTTRVSQVAGRFFPGETAALTASLEQLCARGGVLRDAFPEPPRAVISPHAGYTFSGPLTAAAWQLVARGRPDRIAILSPSHTAAFDGIAVDDSHGAVECAGLTVPLDRKGAKALIKAGKARGRAEVFAQEHGIDTQLPFAAHLLPGTEVLPVVIGQATDGQVAGAIQRIARLPGTTAFVLSSDLSHFLTQDKAVRMDAETAQLIEAGEGGALTPNHACGARGIAGYLASRPGRGARTLRLGQFTSFDSSGDASRVVGYGAWGLWGPEQPVLSRRYRRELLTCAREAIASRLDKGRAPSVDLATYAMPLRSQAASFVTLEKSGALRGCIGSLAPRAPLVADIAANAVKSALEDPRFPPLCRSELEAVEIKLSVLTRPARLPVRDEDALLAALVPGRTGLILTEGARRGVFLPSVWTTLPDPDAFLAALRRKAGLPDNHWSDRLIVETFEAESFSESGERD